MISCSFVCLWQLTGRSLPLCFSSMSSVKQYNLMIIFIYELVQSGGLKGSLRWSYRFLIVKLYICDCEAKYALLHIFLNCIMDYHFSRLCWLLLNLYLIHAGAQRRPPPHTHTPTVSRRNYDRLVCLPTLYFKMILSDISHKVFFLNTSKINTEIFQMTK